MDFNSKVEYNIFIVRRFGYGEVFIAIPDEDTTPEMIDHFSRDCDCDYFYSWCGYRYGKIVEDVSKIKIKSIRVNVDRHYEYVD